MNLLFWAAAVVALLGVLILVHESGHFLFAKFFDVKVIRFSLGFGPRLFGFQRGETEYQLSLIPLGGYVRLLGEDPSEPIPPIDRRRALAAKPLWQRYTIVVAGPVFNLLLPLLIYFVHYAGQRTLLPPTIGTVLPDLPAAVAGLLPGDEVETVDGQRIRYWEELERVIAENAGKTMRFGIRRGQEIEERDVTPVEIERAGTLRLKERVGWIGVSPRFHLPEVGVLDPSSPAAQAGLKTFDFVTAVNGVPVTTWTEFEKAIDRVGASPLRLNFLRGGYSALPFAHVELQQPGSAVVIPVPVFDGAGHRHYETGIVSAELFVYSVEPGSPADTIGIRRGDEIVALDGEALPHWDLLRERLAASPDRTFHITWLSPGGLRHEATFRQEVREEMDAYRQQAEHLVFGALNRLAWKTEAPVPISNRFGYAIGHAFDRTGKIIFAMANGFVEIVRGRVPLTTLGGPIMIGYVAGVAAEQGFDQYLWLMALISINLGLLNFLPVPILDGGLLVFFTLELFKRQPPSPRAREIASYVGLVIVAALMLFALRNDVVRYLLPMITAATRLLCLDTSTPAARVAVVDGAGIAIARAEATAERHSTHVLKLVDDVLRGASLRPADLDAIACGAGPGSFTGLRVGLAVAKGLALATDKPLLLVSSLRALAIDIARAPAAAGAAFVIPCIDAGKGEVYACVVAASDPAGDGRSEADEPWRLAPAALAARLADYPGAILAGNGAERHAAALDAALPAGVRRAPIEGPTALAIAELALARFARGEADDLDKAVPAYGRPPDITKKKPVVLG